jgi:predicted RNA binding protein YcfA (HicA-like mRNA interferase family)
MRTDNKLKPVLKAFNSFGFEVVSFREHIKLQRSGDGQMAVVPNHKVVKGTTLQRILRDAKIDKNEFFKRM